MLLSIHSTLPVSILLNLLSHLSFKYSNTHSLHFIRGLTLTPTASTLHPPQSSISPLPQLRYSNTLSSYFIGGLSLTPTASSLHSSQSPILSLPQVFQHSALTFNKGPSSHTHSIHSPPLLISYPPLPQVFQHCPNIL